jgi:glycosyltransferase involved in cell wall biosynthesis
MPAYNAARHLEETIGRIPAALWERIASVWIVNDGSGDDTAAVALRIAAARPQVRVHTFERNQGYGGTARAGLALCQKDGCDIVVCLHADGQYPPEEIPRFVNAIESNALDLLQGSRIASGTALSGGMPLYKYVANRALTAMENAAFGLRMSDYHSGYLFYGQQALTRIRFERLSSSFDFDLEVIASAVALGLRVGELPIATRYAGEVSHLNPVTYGLRCLGVMLKYLAGGYR